MEWIPFEQFYNITKLTEGGFSSIYIATWTRGIIDDYDENKKEFSYSASWGVVLKSLNNSSSPGKGFFDEVGIFYLKQKKIMLCKGGPCTERS